MDNITQFHLPLNPDGLCQCGCGRPAPIARCQLPQYGYTKGQPMRFIAGHGTRGRRTPAIKRFNAKVRYGDTPASCWTWVGCKDRLGYGKFSKGGRSSPILAHRWAYEYFVEPIPAGLELDHLCRNPSCVNPTHLEPVTHALNMKRAQPGYQPGRELEYCRNGHPYDASNTRIDPRSGGRFCKTCNKLRARALRARLKK